MLREHALLAATLLLATASAAPLPPATSGKAGATPWKLDLERVRLELDGGYVADLDGEQRAWLTLDPTLQAAAAAALDRQAAPLGAVVVVGVDDGKVLALAGRGGGQHGVVRSELAIKPWAPAASVFKVVTAAALVGRGVPGRRRVCYHGGISNLDRSNLRAFPRLDDACDSFAMGLARSQNAIIARLATDHLSPRILDETATALGFGVALPFDLQLEPSMARIPSEPLHFAQVAAGFWETTMSPLHGAWLAATIARGGVTPPLRLVERVSRLGTAVELPTPAEPRRVLDGATARAVGEMMVGTTEVGTARSGFHDRRGRAYLRGMRVAGKTGTLYGWTTTGELSSSRKRQSGAQAQKFVAYSWFVGYAPADHPEVAFAVLLGNDGAGHRRAHRMAREVLASWFASRGAAHKTLVAER